MSEESPASDSREERSDRDVGVGKLAWVAGVAVPVVTAACLVGVVLMTPGTPFACRVPNPRAWFLCRWYREFVANAVLVATAVCGGCVLLAFLVGYPRAILREIRR